MLIFLFSTLSYGQQNFKVIKVNGTITLKTKGISLQTGTVFAENEDLLFRSDDATAAVINSQKGRLILTSKNHDLSSASSNYLPPMYNVASRGLGSLISLTDMKENFSGKYAILGRQLLEVNPKNFPMNKENFFFLRYIYKGEEINKKLDFSGDTLIIDKNSIYKVDGKPITKPDNTQTSLYYRKGTESLLVNNFDLIFPDEKQLVKEVKIILDEFAQKTGKEKINEVGAYINENYGKISRDNLLPWLEKNTGFKINK
jgi:hypothetical protein